MLQIVSFLILIISLTGDGLAQSSNNRILLKGGTAGYGNIQGIQISGGGGPGDWKIGPILGVGIERELNKSWSLQATFEYSNNIYDGSKAWKDSLIIGKNTVVDLMGNIKKKWNWFYLIAGVGFSIQKSSETYSVAYDNSIYSGGRYYKYIMNEGTSAKGLTGLLGIGIQFRIVKNIEIFFEGSIRGRRYGSTAAQIGIIHEI
ncbi:MAG: hypothetical protein COZ80_13115 [Ignavibacteria bacterium CG_4_8_14_3_um_filter_37_9]|nr:hypothetical protein [Ignavibacteria bacterium]OIO16965.1 MAG: hypothetical protein AUJ54_10540 [Ignavibacteria bacterium CG1_02_37_35]PIP77957.1 MAG: hypothetical protein COW85_06245 [Ignavibacteria bacterium CG22_combo_CG10-13_8_21_14_all_37_15]PIS43739.1 MAG: hypothetical protein COT22_14225 [Ignavibacteria bacterium CG08_land_8_20_14_0_20_37_9]PIW97949.1 MAG: hypothetical protein COZ80_13115 [Ignavibacteria bacterium CG_4_8_14_3_um_filter_37_9]PIX95095.1 MAG: hypothetical protein COZ25_